MDYKILSKLYYRNKAEYSALLSERINSENTHILNIKINENEAFYCICPEIYELSASILTLDKKVFELENSLPQAALKQFTNSSLISEIVLTNSIEGVHSTRKEISQLVGDFQGKIKKRRFYGLVTKYKMLNRTEIPLKSCEDIRKIYDELVLPEVIKDDPSNAPDGKLFRKELAEVVTPTQKTIHTGLYPESKIIGSMEAALKILNTDSIPILLRIAVFHYFFGYIHPFYDGNGRTSRFISSYLLAESFEPLIGYRVSHTIKEHIGDYYDAFKITNDAKNHGDLTPFIIMFLNIINLSYENLYESLLQKASLLQEYETKLNESGVSESTPESIIEVLYILLQTSLFSSDGITKNELCDELLISPSTLDKRLSLIKELVVIEKIGKTNFYKLNTDII